MIHSKLGASSAYRWFECPGSVRACEKLPNISSKYALEGTDAHQLGEKCLKQNNDTDRYINYTLEHGTVVDAEMAEYVQVYIDTVRADFNPKTDDELFVEKQFQLEKIHDAMFGTNDACVYKPKEKKLIVYDLKYGAGVPVEVENNKQLMYYGLGAAMEADRAIDVVELVIVQPRCFHPDGPVRRWSIDILDLQDFAVDLLNAAVATEDPNAPLVPGGHCHWCPNAGTPCPALLDKAHAAAQHEFSDDKPYDPDLLAETLAWLDTFESWCKSVRNFAYNEATRGVKIPLWKLVNKASKRRLKDTVTADMLVSELDFLTVDDVSERKLKGIGAIEKLIKAEFPGRKKSVAEMRTAYMEAFNSLTEKPDAGTALVPESDKRDAVTVGPEADFS